MSSKKTCPHYEITVDKDAGPAYLCTCKEEASERPGWSGRNYTYRNQETAMFLVEITSPDFLETYAFNTTTKGFAGRYIARLIAVGMIPSRNIVVKFVEA